MVAQEPPDPSAAEAVRAELPGTVLEVLVAVGQAVRADQELVLLESMKMEVPVLPERDGVVAEVAVAPGDVVRVGEPVVRLVAPG